MALIAICDINPKTLHKVGDQLGIPEEKRFTDWKEILRIEGLEAVLIVTPDQLHLEAIVRAADRSSAKFMAGQISRFTDAFEKGKGRLCS